MNPLRIVVIGAGHMGTLHAKKLSQLAGVEVAAVADVDRARAEALATQFRARSYVDWRQALTGVHAAVVAVPTDQHAAVLHGCLEHELHALVEKPIATNVEDAAALVALAHRRHVVLQVAHVERFNAAFRAIASRIDRPLFVDAERLAEFKRRGAEVDVVLDLMIHDIDLTLALVGDDVSDVRACGFSVLTPGIDIANVHLEFRSGCVANLSASRVSQSAVRKLRVFQDNLYASADLQVARVRYVRRAESAVEQSDESFEGSDPLAAQDASFVAAVRRERPVPVTGEDGRRALDIALTVGRLVHERLRRFESKLA